MVYRRKSYRRTYKRKPFRGARRYRRKRNTYQSISRNKTVSSDVAMVKLPYFATFNFTGTTESVQLFNMNSLFDPDATGTGHQPRGFDQWAAFYQNYQVLAHKTEIEFVSDSTKSVDCVICYSDTNSSADAISNAGEYKYAFPLLIPPSGSGTKRFVKYMTEKKIHGYRTLTQLDNTIAPITSSPSDPSYMWIRMGPADGASTINVWVNVRITYYAKMSAAKNPAQS